MDDDYRNKVKFERTVRNISSYLNPPEEDSPRKYYIKNKANLKYFKQLFNIWEAQDLSYIRRNRLITTMLLICHATSKNLKDCDREDTNKIVAYMHKKYQSPESKSDFIKHVKLFWRKLFPELDEKGRIDDSITPYAVRHLSSKVDKSKQRGRRDRMTYEEYKKIIDFFAHDPEVQFALSLMRESYARPQEILWRRISDVEMHDNYAVIHVNDHGKEGYKTLDCIDSFKYLTGWFNIHPRKNEHDAWLFLNYKAQKSRHNRMTGANLNKKLKLALQRLGINKPITLYSFKRNGITHDRISGVSAAEIQHTAGWSSVKQLMKGVYDLSNSEDYRKKKLLRKGIAQPGVQEEKRIGEIKKCLYCDTLNPFTFEYCELCKRPLDAKKIAEPLKKIEELQSQMEKMRKEMIALRIQQEKS